MTPVLGQIDCDELWAKIQGGHEFVLVDALSPMSYAVSHLPGAISITPRNVDEQAPRRISELDTEVVVYCAGPTCDTSVIVAERLLELGYRNVSHYAGGKSGWTEAGLPLDRGGT